MARPASDWRARYGAAMNRARTIERQAAGLRASLAALASGEDLAGDVDRAVAAIRYQLELVERLAAQWRAEGAHQHPSACHAAQVGVGGAAPADDGGDRQPAVDRG
jgi:hypothetical protein